MADSLASLQIQLELQSASFTAEMQKVNGQLNKLNKDVGGISAGFSKLGTVLKGAAVLGAFTAVSAGISSFVQSISKSIDAMDEMSKASQKVGVAVETLSGLKYAAEQSGVGFEALQNGVKKLNQNLADFDTSTDASAQSLKNLGIALGDTTEQALAKIADRFQSMPDGVQKTALAMNIFGKSGADLIPLLNAGSKGIGEFQSRAKELGQVFGTLSAQQAEVFNDSMADLSKAFTGIVNNLVIGMLPALSATAKAFSDSAKAGEGWQEVGKGLGLGIIEVAIASVRAAQTIAALTQDVKVFAKTVISFGQVLAFLPGDKFQALKDIGSGVEHFFSDTTTKTETGADRLLGVLTQARDDIINGVVATANGVKAAAGGAGGAGGGGKGALSLFDSWIEGLKKTSQESELLGPKMKFITLAIGELEAAGKKGSETWKVYNAERKKLEETAAAGSVGAELTLQIEKTREAANKAAESMVILGQKYHDFLEMGDVEGAQIALKMMDDFRDKTKEAATDIQKLGADITTAIQTSMVGSVDKFIDSIGTAKISFGDFAISLLKDIAKLTVKMLILAPLMRSIGGFFGGFGGGAQAFPVSPYAFGDSFRKGTSLSQGVYDSPTLFKFANGGTIGSRTGVLAEAGRSEAIVPLIRHGKDLGVAASPVNVIVNNHTDGQVSVAESTNSDGTKQIDIYIEKKIKEVFSSGGMDRTMRGSYGLTRVGA